MGDNGKTNTRLPTHICRTDGCGLGQLHSPARCLVWWYTKRYFCERHGVCLICVERCMYVRARAFCRMCMPSCRVDFPPENTQSNNSKHTQEWKKRKEGNERQQRKQRLTMTNRRMKCNSQYSLYRDSILSLPLCCIVARNAVFSYSPLSNIIQFFNN